MQKRSKTLKVIALMELLIGIIFILLAFLMFKSGDSISAEKSGLPLTFVFLVMGMVSFIGSPVLYFISKRMEEKENADYIYDR
jgi:Zn-dependent protease with chaperone function